MYSFSVFRYVFCLISLPQLYLIFLIYFNYISCFLIIFSHKKHYGKSLISLVVFKLNFFPHKASPLSAVALAHSANLRHLKDGSDFVCALQRFRIHILNWSRSITKVYKQRPAVNALKIINKLITGIFLLYFFYHLKMYITVPVFEQ